MVLAAVLFCVGGAVNGVYPGGRGWDALGGFAVLTYVFGALNLLVAAWIWRGSERGLVTRIGLAVVFLAVVVALAYAEPTPLSIGIYAVTGLIEIVILVDAIRVWRISHTADTRDLDAIFALDTPLPVAGTPAASLVVAPQADGPALPALSARLTWLIGLLALALAVVLVADGIATGFVPGPGGRAWGFYGTQSGWLVYVFAMVVLVVAVRAVHASTLALQLLFATALIVFIERPFSPFVLGAASPSELALHLVAALLALALGVSAVIGIRAIARSRQDDTGLTLGHATSAE